MSTKISGSKYAAMYGPTTGYKVRLADTSLVIEVEKDYTTYGDEKIFGIKKPSPQAKTVESKVPVYKREEEVQQIHVKAGRFSSVVRREYEQYLRSKNPSISHVIKNEINKVEDSDKKEKDPRSKRERMFSAVVGFFSNDNSDDTDIPADQVVPVDDYRGRRSGPVRPGRPWAIWPGPASIWAWTTPPPSSLAMTASIARQRFWPSAWARRSPAPSPAAKAASWCWTRPPSMQKWAARWRTTA